MRTLFARLATLTLVVAAACTPILNSYLWEWLSAGPHGPKPWA